jgi:hypothetical protein
VPYRFAADATLVIHLAFVLFVMLGAALSLRWRWVPRLHLPAAVWGAAVEFTGSGCPLTGLENRMRVAAGEAGYSGGFVEHYLVPLIYPPALTREMQAAFGIVVVLVNVALYAWLVRRGTWRPARS